MSLVGALDVLTDSERARHPGSLAIQAYFDGWNQAAGGGAGMFPRFLTRDEEESWRDGWREAKAERAVYGDACQEEVATVSQLRPRRDCSGCPILTEAEAA